MALAVPRTIEFMYKGARGRATQLKDGSFEFIMGIDDLGGGEIMFITRPIPADSLADFAVTATSWLEAHGHSDVEIRF